MSDARLPGETKDVGFQIGARRTFDVPAVRAWEWLTSRAGLALWLGAGTPPRLAKGARYRLRDGAEGEVRVVASGRSASHLRLTWRPSGWARATTVQLRVVPKGGRTTVAFHQEHLPGPAEREERRAFYRAVLDALGQRLG